MLIGRDSIIRQRLGDKHSSVMKQKNNARSPEFNLTKRVTKRSERPDGSPRKNRRSNDSASQYSKVPVLLTQRGRAKAQKRMKQTRRLVSRLNRTSMEVKTQERTSPRSPVNSLGERVRRTIRSNPSKLTAMPKSFEKVAARVLSNSTGGKRCLRRHSTYRNA